MRDKARQPTRPSREEQPDGRPTGPGLADRQAAPPPGLGPSANTATLGKNSPKSQVIHKKSGEEVFLNSVSWLYQMTGAFEKPNLKFLTTTSRRKMTLSPWPLADDRHAEGTCGGS